MSFTIDDIVRTLVAVLLRTDPWRHRFLCYRCLLALTLDSPVGRSTEPAGPPHKDPPKRPARTA